MELCKPEIQAVIADFLKEKKSRVGQDTSYMWRQKAEPYQPLESLFKCKIQHIDTEIFAFLNGFYVHHNVPLTVFSNGSIFGSLAAAKIQYPDLVAAHLGKTKSTKEQALSELNSEMWQDGFFIYIPENTHFPKNIQWINLIKSLDNLFIAPRNLIILEKGAKLSLIHCDDDSSESGSSFMNGVTEMFIKENAELTYYKMENKDPQSVLINQLCAEMQKNAGFKSFFLTFNAGFVHHHLTVNLNEEQAHCELYGTYLVDKQQQVETRIMVNHRVGNCKSLQHYKGILDDEARAVFNGCIYVAKNTQKTEAHQINRNLSLTDDAKVFTQPFLEIYADDVQCSHGTTFGQLDENALFYLRTRGISEKSAKTLLMYAFVNEIIRHIELDSLKTQLSDMVKKRLSGELNHCQHCVLHCSQAEGIWGNGLPNLIQF